MQTKRVYLPTSTFEVTRTPHPNGDEFSADLISGDVDMEDLADAELEAIEVAKAEWAKAAFDAADREIRAFEASNRHGLQSTYGTELAFPGGKVPMPTHMLAVPGMRK